MAEIPDIAPFRYLGKLFYFLGRGHPPQLARWLARHDAPRFLSYRGLTVEQLAQAWDATQSWGDLQVAGGRVNSRKLGLPIDRPDPLSHGYSAWLALQQRGWTFTLTDGRLFARSAILTVPIVTLEECDMFREIFLDGVYDLRPPGTWRVVDIGGNVAMASLFFASQPWVKRVFSFEPFSPTAACFAQNIALNPMAAAKISLQPIGLGDQTTRLRTDYHPHLRGSMSTQGLGTWRQNDTATESVEIEIVRARDALGPILQDTSTPLLAKIDCEGGEYGILRDLDEAGLLQNFAALVIEWHGRGPAELVERLSRRGFLVHVQPLNPDESLLGLIYATRQSPSPNP